MAQNNSDAWKMYQSQYPTSTTAYEAEKHGIDAKVYMNAMVKMENIYGDYIYNGKRVDGSRLTKEQRKKAKLISNSRRPKVSRYLNSVCKTEKDYLFLLGTEFSNIKDDYAYVRCFGK